MLKFKQGTRGLFFLYQEEYIHIHTHSQVEERSHSEFYTELFFLVPSNYGSSNKVSRSESLIASETLWALGPERSLGILSLILGELSVARGGQGTQGYERTSCQIPGFWSTMG